MFLKVRRLALVAFAGLLPTLAHAQTSICSSEVEEFDATKYQLYQMFDDLYLRPESSKLTPTQVSPRLVFQIGNSLQVAFNTGRWRPHFGKCDPVTDRSLYDIQQLFPNQPTTSGGAMDVSSGSSGLQGSAAFGAAAVGTKVVVGYVDRGDFTPFHAFRWTLAGGAEAAGLATVGASRCICVRSKRRALARGAAARGDDPGPMRPAG